VVMDDPDFFELQDYEGTDVFVPGGTIEREIDGNKMFEVLILTGVGFGMTVVLTIAILFPLLAVGLVYMTSSFDIVFAPWSMVFLSLTEFGFIIPPVWYARRNGYSLKSIGLKFNHFAIHALQGLGVGVVMLAANIAITYAIAVGFDLPIDNSAGLFLSTDWLEVVGWVLVMFFCVGFSEEVIFRGFLQRRMEIYFRGRHEYYQILALVVTSFIFAAIHLDIIGLTARFVLGLFMGALAQHQKYSIVGSSVAHGFNNSAVVILAFMGF
jgi:membrane protease YdiL (CAAX protease family)